MAIPHFKIVMVGGGGVGKSTFLKRYMGARFDRKYVATLAVVVHPLLFHTNHGPIKLNIWDLAGQEKFGGRRNGWYREADGTILMFAVDSELSYRELPDWFVDIDRVAPGLPTVVCGNKVELPERQVEAVDFHRRLEREHRIPTAYYDISVKNNQNLEEPFLWLARQLTGHRDLCFVETPTE
uniref:Ras family GTPase n=1 Tax=Pithovirus LCPAC103 TaxID=2506588 RepID=A0A481Z6H3_9VIRU|nr:MAG: Ras family GTPase [Pithovirus LCPAC103]